MYMGLPTVNSEGRFGFSHTWGSRARVFAQIRFLQASYLQHDRRLPFLVGVSPLVDFVPASALTYHLRLACRDRDANRFRYSTSLVRINRASRHPRDRCSKSRWPRSGEQLFNKKPNTPATKRFASHIEEIVEQRILSRARGTSDPNCQYCLNTYPLMITCSFRIHKLIVLG